MVTIRLRDPPIKWVLRRIHLDSEGKIDRPLGNPTSHNNVAPPAVPLASGMGRQWKRSSACWPGRHNSGFNNEKVYRKRSKVALGKSASW